MEILVSICVEILIIRFLINIIDVNETLFKTIEKVVFFMEYTWVKGTGLSVSRFCLGTMTFGEQTSEVDACRMVDYALDQGVNFFDTADTYTGGKSENILGKALEGKRTHAVIATKLTNPKGPQPNNSGQGRKHIMQGVEESLNALRTDYIDILYLHHPDPHTPMEEAAETMTELVRSGKIRYYGLSNYSAWQCCSFIHKAKENHLLAPVITESVYNLITRGLDDEMTSFLLEYKMGLAVYNPIAAGLLSGKHGRTAPAPDSRMADNKGYNLRYWKDSNLDAVEKLTTVAKDAGMSLLELALQWLLNRPAVDSIIVGASKYDHVVQNISLASETKTLSPDVMSACDEIWAGLKGNYYSYHELGGRPKGPTRG